MSGGQVRIGRLDLSAPRGTDGDAFARRVAADLQGRLTTAGVTGTCRRIDVQVTADEARDPAAIARAVTRALKGAKR